MAKFETDVGLDDFMSDLSSVDIAMFAPVALEKASPLVVEKMQQLSRPHKKSGKMYKSIKAQKPNKKKDGYSLFVGASGVDKKTGVRNMEKMAYLEFGVKSHNQKPTPVITPTVEATRTKVCDSMQETFDEYAKGLNL